MFVLILPVISACKEGDKKQNNEIAVCKKEKNIEQNREDIIADLGKERFPYYRNFKITEATMSRVSIDGVPCKGKNLYMLKLEAVGCNLDYLRSRGDDFFGGFLRAYVGGSIDSVDDLIITKRGEKISHTPLRWKELKPYDYCQMWVSSKNGKDIIYYNHDFNKILEEIRWPAITILMRPPQSDVCTFCYLLCFKKSKSLPDSAILRLSRGDVNIKIDNRKIDKYSIYKLRHLNYEGCLYTSKCYDNI